MLTVQKSAGNISIILYLINDFSTGIYIVLHFVVIDVKGCVLGILELRTLET